jgi:uncharacterized protein YueI
MSDGNTNHLRANMLFPFMCYHFNESETCPKIIKGEYAKINGLLLKTRIIENVEAEGLNIEIINETKKVFNQKLIDIGDPNQNNFGFIDETIEKLGLLNKCKVHKFSKTPKSDVFDGFFRHCSRGLFSVLERIDNFTDFVIALSSDKIINMYDEKFYVPLKRADSQRHNVRYYDFSKSFEDVGSTQIISREVKVNLFNYLFRKELVKKLNSITINFSRLDIFTVSTSQLELTEMTTSVFNSTIEVCKENKQNTKVANLFNNFVKISDVFSKMTKQQITKKIEKIKQLKQNILNQDSGLYLFKINQFNDKIVFLNKINELIFPYTIYSNGEEIRKPYRISYALDRNIDLWNAKC